MANGNNKTPNYLSSDNAFGDFLEYKPEAAYYSSPKGTAFGGGSPAAQQFYERSFGDIYNQYLGKLGSQIRSGEAPTLKWTEYLEQDPFTDRYTALPPSQRCSYTGAYSPTTRRIFF